ncbi:MAG: hypothetical protein AAFU78_07300, partial [Cyanobacteria bacterium J06633_2]
MRRTDVLKSFLPSRQLSSKLRSSGKNRFKLLKNFSMLSLSTFSIATILLAVFYYRQAVNDLIASTEEHNVSTTQLFANTIWPKYGSFLSSTQDLNKEALVAHSSIQQLREDTITQFENLSVVQVKIFDLQGRTVFSTNEAQIGEDKSQSSGFLIAKSGDVVSQLGHRDTLNALQETIEDRDLLSSYIPIYDDDFNEDVVGVFELYTDVTHLLQRIEQAQRQIVGSSVLLSTVLFGILFIFVKRADYLLEKQYQQVQESELRYRHQASELKKTLDELQQTQVQMLQNEKMS